MKYESNAENNVEKKVLNEFVPTIATKQLNGALGRGQTRFGAQVKGNDYKVQQATRALYQNLAELLKGDEDAETKKIDIAKMLYRWVKGGPLGGQQPQQAVQPQNGQQQIPGTF